MPLYAVCSDPLCREWREYDPLAWRLPYVWCRLCGANAVFRCKRCGLRIHEKLSNGRAQCRRCGYALLTEEIPKIVAGSISYLNPLAKARRIGVRRLGFLDQPTPQRIAVCTNSNCRHVVVFSPDDPVRGLHHYVLKPIGKCPVCRSMQIRSCPRCGAGRYDLPVEWPFICLDCGINLVPAHL